MSKTAEKCIFCGWNRRTSWPNTKFFSFPREPGLKKVRWLMIVNNQNVTYKDKVCSIHFRSGRPSNDTSHIDFVPHLYITNEIPTAVKEYFELHDVDAAAETNAVKNVKYASTTEEHPVDQNSKNESQRNIVAVPAIMQRKRKLVETIFIEGVKGGNCVQDSNTHPNHMVHGGPSRSFVECQPLQRNQYQLNIKKKLTPSSLHLPSANTQQRNEISK